MENRAKNAAGKARLKREGEGRGPRPSRCGARVTVPACVGAHPGTSAHAGSGARHCSILASGLRLREVEGAEVQVRPREHRAGPLQAVQAVLRACSLQEGRSPGDCHHRGQSSGSRHQGPSPANGFFLGCWVATEEGADVDLGPGWSPGRWYHDQVDRARG